MLTNSVAVEPLSITAMLPHGPLMFGPAQTSASWPLASSTSRQPSPLVRVVPSVLGVLPTITQPLFSMVIAVVRPTPPGHCGKILRQLGERGSSFSWPGCSRRSSCRCPADSRVVEIVDQHVVLLDLAGGDRRHDDGVGVEVAVVGHRRGQGDVAMDRAEHPGIFRRRRQAARDQYGDQQSRGRGDPSDRQTPVTKRHGHGSFGGGSGYANKSQSDHAAAWLSSSPHPAERWRAIQSEPGLARCGGCCDLKDWVQAGWSDPRR